MSRFNISLIWKPRDISRMQFSNLKNTLYIGNLSYSVKENRIWSLFKKVGVIKRIIMGLNRYTFTSCGFCFVVFFNKRDTVYAFSYLNGIKIDTRFLRIDIDEGFKKGRQFGRGKDGGQMIDNLQFIKKSRRT